MLRVVQGHVADERRRVDPARQRRRVEHGGGARAARPAHAGARSRPRSCSALAGPPLATYTGVLLADTAVPVWHEARRELPWIFGASAAASAGAAACMFVHPREAGPARRLALGGVARRGRAHAGDGAPARRRRRGLPAGRRPASSRGRRRGLRQPAPRCSRRAARAAAAAAVPAARSSARASCACAGQSSRPDSSRRATRSTWSSRSASARTAGHEGDDQTGAELLVAHLAALRMLLGVRVAARRRAALLARLLVLVRVGRLDADERLADLVDRRTSASRAASGARRAARAPRPRDPRSRRRS